MKRAAMEAGAGRGLLAGHAGRQRSGRPAAGCKVGGGRAQAVVLAARVATDSLVAMQRARGPAAPPPPHPSPRRPPPAGLGCPAGGATGGVAARPPAPRSLWVGSAACPAPRCSTCTAAWAARRGTRTPIKLCCTRGACGRHGVIEERGAACSAVGPWLRRRRRPCPRRCAARLTVRRAAAGTL